MLKPLKIIALILLLTCIGLVLFYYYQNNPSNNQSFFVVCLTNLWFDLDCLGCGGQRALHQLLHGNVKMAVRNNALFVLGLPFWIYVTFVFVCNQVLGKKYQSPILSHPYFAWIFIGIIILFMILRNLPWYPFDLLAATNN